MAAERHNPDDAAMSQSEFGDKLRRVCWHGPARRVTKARPARNTVRHNIAPTVEMLWTGPGLGDDEGA